MEARAVRTANSSPTTSSHDGVTAFAKDAAGTGECLQRGDGKKAFDEDFEQFDEAAVFLDGNNQAVVFLAEMFLHELGGFPVHQFALGAVGAPLSFGGFCSDFFKVLVRIEDSFSASRRGGVDLRCWRSTVGMLERPFQNAMNDEVGITTNGRSEVGVLVEAESKMAERLGGVASLLEGTEHKVGDDALFRFADDLFNQALIVLRRDPQIAGRERHLHAALAAVAVGVRATGFRRRRNAAMANSDFALVQIFDAERVTEGAGQLFELEDFADIGLFMNAMERLDAAAKQIRGDRAIGGEQERFNEAEGQAVCAGLERTHAVRKSLRKHGDGAIGEINGSAAEARFLVEWRGGSNVVRDVGDVDLKMPASVGAMLDVDGVVEIARGFAIDGDDGQVAEIFAAGALGFVDGLCATLGFIKNFCGEEVREMMLANDDLGVDAEIAGTAENFDDAAGRRCASMRITEQLDVDDGAVEFIEARDAPRAGTGFIGATEAEFFPEAGRQFVAAENFNFVLDAKGVGKDEHPVGAVARKDTD